MRAKLKHLHSPDVPDLKTYAPTEHANFGFLLQMLVGPDVGEGEEAFDVVICTPAWLADRHARDHVVLLRHHILMNEYRYEYLDQDLRRIIEAIEGTTWRDVAEKLARVGAWEFEDYQPA